MTYRMPYTTAGCELPEQNFFELYQKIVKEILEIEFDVEIIGCGIYGYLITGAIKESGRQAIEMCGETQIIFGINGKRWIDGGYIKDYINEFWCHLLQHDVPENAKRIEGGVIGKNKNS